MLGNHYKVKKNAEFVSSSRKSAHVCRVNDYYELIDFRHADKKEYKKILIDKIEFIRKRFGGLDVEYQLYSAFENIYKIQNINDLDKIVKIIKRKNIACIEFFLRIQCINIKYNPSFFRVS